MSMNSSMKQLIERDKDVACTLSSKLEAVLRAGFRQVGDCLFFSSLFDEQSLPNTDFIQQYYLDSTGYECAINQIHLEDYCDADLLCVSRLFVERFLSKWSENFAEAVVAILSYEVSEEFGEISIFRFHTKRLGEAFINSDDIESFGEALMMVEVGPR